MSRQLHFLKQIGSLKNHRSFFLLIITYFLTHLFFRLLLTNSLEVDEAEQVFLSQKLLLGYNQQPPLYTWIIIFITKLFGYSLLSIIIFRTLLLIGIFTLVFTISKQYQDSFLDANISTLSLFLFFQLSVESFRQTHTVLITFSVVFMIWSFTRLIRNPSNLNYIILGITITLGILSKYNFVISLLAFLLAVISDIEYRKIILNKKISLSILVFLVLITPHFIWLYKNMTTTSEETINDLATQNLSYISTITPSIWAISKGILSFAGLFFVSILLLLKGKIKSVFKTQKNRFVNFLGRFLTLSVLIFVIILIFTKATNAHERWIQPLLIITPIYVFCCIDEHEKSIKRYKIFKNILIIIAALTLLYKPLSIGFGPSLGFTERINRPYFKFSKFLLQNHSSQLEKSNLIICDAIDFTGTMKVLMPNHFYDTFTAKNDLFYTAIDQYNNKTILLLGTSENNQKLVDSIKSKVSNLSIIESSSKTFFYNYSNKKTYTFYYTFITICN